MKKYTVGVDFGSLSARALVVDAESGAELGGAVMDYPHAVIDRELPTGERLPKDWALQHPRDYLECLSYVIRSALENSGVPARDIAGLGVDFTASTLIPVDENLEPLCFSEEFARRPHAWPTLWKHHAAQYEANRLTELAKARGETFLERYGGKFSSEWTLPKIVQVLDEAPDVYARARFIEAGDWLTAQMTGARVRSASIAGYKMLWDGAYHSKDFLRAIDKRLENLADEKLPGTIKNIGDMAGRITESGAELTGLDVGTPVAVCNIDAHASLPATGAVDAGRLLMIMGTSTCHIMTAETLKPVPGICGAVKNGVAPGLYGYEAGQSCVGDALNWYAENCAPAKYAEEAREKGVSLHALLTERAARLRPGESGLIALDWLNGNRSVLTDMDLTGLLMGFTLATKPEEIYRALIEATAFGTRVIVENFETHGVPARELFACGGIAHKNPLMMQIYSDVLNREIKIVRSKQASALGAAIFAACAAGIYENLREAAKNMGGISEKSYVPIAENTQIYEKLFAEYRALHDLFGKDRAIMKRLKNLRE